MAEHIQIGDVAPRIQYTGNGAQTQFAYPFPIFKAADMEVYLDQTKQTTGFAVNGAAQSTGGNVTFTIAPANGVVVTLRRRLAIARTSDFQESGEFRSKVINDELDYLTAALQQVSDDGGRALRLSATDPTAALALPTKTARANMFLAFDAEGQPIASDASGPPGPQGPAGNMDGSNNLSELTNTATARSNLGLGTAAVAAVAAGGSGGLLRADGDGSALTGIVAPDNVARANIVLNAFRIAVQGGLSVQNMVDGVVDEFEDETGVDTGASSNENYDAAGNLYTNKTAATDGSFGLAATIIYGLGDVNSKFGGIRFASSVGGTVTSMRWQVDTVNISYPAVASIYTDNAGSPGTKVGGNSDSITLNSTGIKTFTWSANAPVLSASTNYWAILEDTVASGGDVRFSSKSPKEASFLTGRNSVVTDIVNDTVNDRDLRVEINTQVGPNNMTLVSNATTALAQPSEAFIVVWQQDVGAVTLNTDLKAYASRDGGTTWTQITLVEEAGLGASGRILAGSASISGQPAGTSMKWKLETLNVKEMKIHGVGLEWS